MLGSRLAALLGIAFLLGGCARLGGTRQELARLQSHVNLLDERVTQLERTGPSSAGLSGDSLLPPAGESGMTFAEPKRSTPSKSSGASSSLKPSTREVQQALKNAGFYQGSVDGKNGPQTKEAIKEFQRVHGLTDDGVAGRQTWAKLKPYADLSGGGGGEATAAEVLK